MLDISMIGCANQRFANLQYGVYDVSFQSRKDLSFVKNIILEVHCMDFNHMNPDHSLVKEHQFIV